MMTETRIYKGNLRTELDTVKNENFMNWRLLKEIKEKFRTQTNFSYQTGIDRAAISMMINGWRIPTPAQRKKISQALNVDADILFPINKLVNPWPKPAGDNKDG